MLTRRKFLTTTAALTTASLMEPLNLQGAETSQEKSQRPNILIFMPDQQQGQTVLPEHPCITPNINRFAAQGIIFPNAFCPTPHCCPSRASFQTGLYPSEHGIFNNVANAEAIHPNPYPNIKYFSRILRSAGYELAYSGKWHVARDVMPQDVGWDNLTPGENGGVFKPKTMSEERAYSKARKELAERMPRRPGELLRPGWGNWQMYGDRPPRGEGGYHGLRDYKIVQTAVDGMGKLTSGTKPWCLMVSNTGGHDKYVAPKNFVDLYKPQDIDLPPSFSDTLEDKPRIYQRMRYQYFSQMSNDEVRQSIAHYWSKLSMQDALFGLLLDQLDKSGQADNTIVIYVSDHGDYAAAHGLYAKGIPSFREAYNIPCIIRWPKGIKSPGRRVDALVSTTDFAPTILDAAGALTPDLKLSGLSLLPWLRGESPAKWRDALFTQMNGVELYYTQRIVMTKDYKYVYNGFDYDELYDLRHDPHEMVNLAFPDVKLSRAALEQGKGLTDPDNMPWPPLPNGLDAVRSDLLEKMWKFGDEHNDQIFDSYMTTAMAPLGPGIEHPGIEL